MFVVLLKFSKNKSQASEFMQAHNDWIQRGFDDDVFLMVGSLQPQLGGAIITQNLTQTEIQSRVNEDPFVVQDVVTAEILEITPARTDSRLDFLLG